ncbi:transport and Golgi organization protein 6 homolog isoform X2 [Antennarius striatus]|uniref:transport and Golgi organization protein 6 homolog isoform X2 n=1 Tax=Antennarius striatus TaxID=241820 RepID=UPI0035B16B4B
MTAAILSALKVLTQPLGDPSLRDVGAPQREALSAALRSNRATLLQRLQSDSSLQEARALRGGAMSEADWFSTDTTDATWSFVQECLLLLLALARHLSVELQRFQQSAAPSTCKRPPPEAAPPLPPDVLSFSQQKTVGAALQFVVCLGLCPYLAPGVGVPLPHRSAFGHLVEKLVCGEAAPAAGRRLLTTVNVLLRLAEVASLATLVFTQHLGDLMAALSQLGYRPHRAERGEPERKTQELTSEERQRYREALRSLLGKVYQPIIIKELLILQGGPKQPGAAGTSSGSSSRAALRSAPAWLRRLCGQLLSERLMQPNGVQAVVRAILGGGAGDESDWRKCDGVAKILVTCPQQSTSEESYYRQVCPQILNLLHFADKLTAQQFQRVATRAFLSVVQEKPGFAQQYLLTPLLSPLLSCTTASNKDHSQTAVEESELTRCIEDVYKIWVVGNSSSAPLLKSLEQVIPVIFKLLCFSLQNVSHLRAPCREILLWYLRHSETPDALSTLRRLSGLQGPEDSMTSELSFTPGSDGGARLTFRESCSDEDDALYEKLLGEQQSLQCLMQTLAEMKDCDLPGEFFHCLLQELTSWTAAEDENQEDEEHLDVSAMSLLEVEQQLLGRATTRGQRLALLQVLAVMVESLDHTVLLKKHTQVVDFLSSLFQRACVGLDQAPDLSRRNPVESQMLSLGMTLVAALLSGPQVRAEDYSSMCGLLPLLETLSQMHPEGVVQQLAFNLRAVIATQGAYRPETSTADAKPSGNPPGNPPDRTNQKLGTESNGLQRSPHPSPGSPRNPPTRQPSSEGSASGVCSHTAGRTNATGEFCTTSNKAFSDWLLEACDPDIPTRAAALRSLTQMVQKRNPEAVQAQEKILRLFQENLEHEDSFVYLSAIQGLAALAESYPKRILERLLKDFQHGPSLPTSNKQRSLETRLKVGEVLMRASRALAGASLSLEEW